MNGNYLLYANAVLNLSTTAGMPFDWFYVEPVAFIALTLMDWRQILQPGQLTMLYVAYAMWVGIRWVLFMQTITEQICTYCGIRFLHNKPTRKPKTN